MARGVTGAEGRLLTRAEADRYSLVRHRPICKIPEIRENDIREVGYKYRDDRHRGDALGIAALRGLAGTSAHRRLSFVQSL